VRLDKEDGLPEILEVFDDGPGISPYRFRQSFSSSCPKVYFKEIRDKAFD
jgi:hypothetical protein